jgi:hypothetical protein
MEVYKHPETMVRHYKILITNDIIPEFCSNYIVALFLIKPQSTTLAERLEARKVNNNLNLNLC